MTQCANVYDVIYCKKNLLRLKLYIIKRKFKFLEWICHLFHLVKRENVYFIRGFATHEICIFRFTRWNKWHIHSKNLNILYIQMNMVSKISLWAQLCLCNLCRLVWNFAVWWFRMSVYNMMYHKWNNVCLAVPEHFAQSRLDLHCSFVKCRAQWIFFSGRQGVAFLAYNRSDCFPYINSIIYSHWSN